MGGTIRPKLGHELHRIEFVGPGEFLDAQRRVLDLARYCPFVFGLDCRSAIASESGRRSPGSGPLAPDEITESHLTAGIRCSAFGDLVKTAARAKRNAGRAN